MSILSSFSQESSSYVSKNKKYSLKNRDLKKLGSKANILTPIQPQRNQQKYFEARQGEQQKQDCKQELSVLASTFAGGNSFSCLQTVQSVLDFNLATSVNLVYAGQNIQMEPQQLSTLKIASKTGKLNQKIRYSKVQLSNSTKYNEDNENFNIIQDQLDKSMLRLDNSRLFIVQSSMRAKNDNIRNKNKFSLRRSSSALKPPLSCSFQDLERPLRPLKNQQQIQMLDFRQNLQKNCSDGLTKFLCNNFISFNKQGCRCDPKCIWISKWLNQVKQLDIKFIQTFIPEIEWKRTLVQIEKDIPRTQVNDKTFKSEEYQQRLREVLINYCKVDWEVGYIQGMNIVASAIVYHSSKSYEDLRAFQFLLRQINLRNVYKSDLSFGLKVAEALEDQLQRLSFDLYFHFSEQQIDIKLFARGWYFSLLGTFVPLEWMHGIIDKFVRRSWRGINQVIISLLLLLKQQLLRMDEEDLMVALSSKGLQQRSEDIQWFDVLVRSDNILLPAGEI